MSNGNVGGVIDALKGQPLMLTMVIMNLALLALFYVVVGKNADLREKEFSLMITNQQRLLDVASRCADGQSK